MNLFHPSGIFLVFLKPDVPAEHLTRSYGFWKFLERLSTNNSCPYVSSARVSAKLGGLEKFCYFSELVSPLSKVGCTSFSLGEIDLFLKNWFYRERRRKVGERERNLLLHASLQSLVPSCMYWLGIEPLTNWATWPGHRFYTWKAT